MKLFRSAADNGFAWNYSKTLGQTVIFWTVFLLVIPTVLFRLEAGWGWFQFTPLPWLGGSAFVALSCLGLWSGWSMARMGQGTPLPMDCPRRLVSQGPYHWVRNPMAVAGIGQSIAVGLAWGSPLVIGYSLVGAVAWHVLVRPEEERDLTDRFGDDYRVYRQQVGLWIPRWRRSQ